jgi:DNA-binding winged helix-turn-helix (wHTH) protein
LITQERRTKVPLRVEFDDWLFDGERRQLLRGSEPVHVSPKAFDLLGLLLAQRPAAVSKAKLKDLLWPATFVDDANLPSLIAEIRTALQDNPRQPR